MDQKLITSILIGALAAVGPPIGACGALMLGQQQPLDARRMGGRIVLLAVIAVLMASGATHDVALLGALRAAAGIAGGAALDSSWVCVTRNSRRRAEGKFYIPRTYIHGVLVSALLLSRIAYRLLVVYPAAHATAPGGPKSVCGVPRKAHSRSRFSGW